MTLPRCVHRAWAAIAGYFWMPCPMCGRYFGGHEISRVSVTRSSAMPTDADIPESLSLRNWPMGHASGMVVCNDPECAYEAGMLQVMNGHPAFFRWDSRFREYMKETE